MLKFFQRPHPRKAHPEPTAASRPAPTLDAHPLRVATDVNSVERGAKDAPETVVSELSELEAHALCAREGIPVFWPRRDRHERD